MNGMNNTVKQIISIVLLIAVFVVFDIGIYEVFTKRVNNKYSEGMQSKSVELDAYLPFDRDSRIVKTSSSVKLEGDLPVVDGAAALYPVFSAFVSALYPEDSVSFNGVDFDKESALQMTNTRGAYKSVVDGDADVVFCAKPSEEQLAYAKEKNVELELEPIGREAFVFIINANNPVESLSVDDVKKIYTQEYTNWSQLGGEKKAIAALQRNEGSGSQTAMLSFMNGEPMKKDWNTFMGSAIGYSFRYYVTDVVADGTLKMVKLNGVEPSVANIRKGEYPIVSNFYAVYRKDNQNENVRKMVDWVLSEEGQKIIEDTGYVSVQ